MRQSVLTSFLPLFLLAPLACMAQDIPAYDPMLADLGDAAPMNVARMSDSDLSCEQLYAESAVIEQHLARMPKPEDPMAFASRMQGEMMDEVKKQQAAMRARSVASSMLSMVPGVGGMAASALASGGADSSHMDQQMTRYMQQAQQMQLQMRAVAEQEARRSHVTNLFLSRGCKTSTLDPVLVQAARQPPEMAGASVPGGAPQPAPGDPADPSGSPADAMQSGT